MENAENVRILKSLLPSTKLTEDQKRRKQVLLDLVGEDPSAWIEQNKDEVFRGLSRMGLIDNREDLDIWFFDFQRTRAGDVSQKIIEKAQDLFLKYLDRLVSDPAREADLFLIRGFLDAFASHTKDEVEGVLE